MSVPPLTDDEALLRRFDPNDSDAVVLDEHDGTITHITSGAMVWDQFDDDDECCSTVREDILASHGQTRWDACDSRNSALAVTSRTRIEAFEYSLPNDGTVAQPFTAADDPVTDPATPINLAHAVAHTRRAHVSMGKRQWAKAKSQLARRAFSVHLPTPSP